jgi:hypothetical protein
MFWLLDCVGATCLRLRGYTHAPSGQSLAGTLKAAKRRKLVTYGPELLLQGTSDKEIIRMPKAE